jgi:PAS domain S-box-containing protein
MGKFIPQFSDFKITRKLAILIYIFVFGIIIMGLAAYVLFKSSESFTMLGNENRVFVETFDSGVAHFYKYEVSGNNGELEKAYEYFSHAFNIVSVFAKADSLMNVMPREEWESYFLEIFKEGFDNDIDKIKFMGAQIRVFDNINHKKLDEIQQIAADISLFIQNITSLVESYRENKSPEKLARLQAEFPKIRSYTQRFTWKLYELNKYVTNSFAALIIFLALFLILTSTLISRRINKSISDPITKLADNFEKMASGNIKPSVKIDSKNEIGQLSRSFSQLQTNLQDIISHSKKIAQGDYSDKLEPKSEEDELAPALNKMAYQLEQTEINHRKENWLQKGINGLDDHIRGNHSVRDLSGKIITYLSHFLKIELAAIYVFDETIDQLSFASSVGLNTAELKENIKIGEGLIGKAALEGSLQIVDTKKKYHKIFSATGEIIPEKIYLLPLFYNESIQGVIELAPVNELSDIKIEFLSSIAERISVSITASVARERHKELLEKTLDQAETLRARDEELSKKLEEITRIQESLIREKALLDSMLHTLPDSVYFKDIDSKFLRISKSMANRFGVKVPEEVIGKSDFDFRSREEAQLYFDEEQKIIKDGEGVVDEIRQSIDKDGKENWTSVTKLPMYDETGKCIGTFGISKNVTQIKQLEVEVKKQNEQLLSNQKELMDVNHLLKQQQEELKSTNEELKSQEEELRVANEEMKSQEEELRVANEELAEQTKILAENEKNLKKQREKLKETNQELKLASQYKSEFLANMSHELRTPLNSLLILSKLLSNNKKGNLTEDQLKSVNIIHKSGKDLLDLINEILDLSKIEAGKMTYNFDEVSVDDIKSEVIQHFGPVAENKALTLEVNQPDDFPKTIFTDKQRLMQIIRNLLSNAFKFTNSGGVKVNMGITPSTAKLVNPDLSHRNTFFIAVEDTGVGIPEGKAEEIFEAFQQADGSISRKYGGTGLGLSISKHLTHVLGGEIHVKSAEGKGSVFTVYLPSDRNLVGKVYNEPGTEKKQVERVEEPASTTYETAEEEFDKNELPVFIDDDRNLDPSGLMVLIIHNEKKKAHKLLELCHKKNFNALVAASISEGIRLASAFSLQAIIISSELNDSNEFQNLKNNKFTRQLPLHFVSRIEDSILDNIDDLRTPESVPLENITQNIENKISKEYKQILVVEDDPGTREAIHILFEDKDIILHEANTGQQAYEMISAKAFDCIILDLGLPDFSGNELLKKLKAGNIPIPNVIIHTARELSAKELRELHKFSDSIVIKGIKSDERLMDEVTLFLHQVANKLPRKVQIKTEVPDKNGFKGKKVLLVDDDIRNVFALAQILEEREIEVMEAENGEVAVETLKKNRDIDLVLMDIMMPVMDGYEAMKIIRNTPGIDDIPIITLSAKAMKEDYQRAINNGANDYISKPVDVSKLLSLLKIWLFK